MSESNPPLGEAIRDISGRFPRYARLAASLAKEGAVSAAGRSPLDQALGGGGFAKLTWLVPPLRRLDQALRSIGAVRSALDEMHSERAERHLEAAGLTREQIERDFQQMSTITRRVRDEGARTARVLMHKGATEAGRATGKGLRALRRWRDRWQS